MSAPAESTCRNCRRPGHLARNCRTVRLLVQRSARGGCDSGPRRARSTRYESNHRGRGGYGSSPIYGVRGKLQNINSFISEYPLFE